METAGKKENNENDDYSLMMPAIIILMIVFGLPIIGCITIFIH